VLDRIPALCLLVLLVLLPAGCKRGAPPFGGPYPGADIIVVSIDSLRADHLGSYGYERATSPGLDALAARGIRFENAMSTTSWTLPAHAALFTGLSDSAHGLVFDGLRLADDQVTLADVLRRAGYHTAGFYGGPYLHSTFGLDRGFEVWQSCMTRIPDEVADSELRKLARADTQTAHRDITGPRTLEEVGRWLETVDERPFLLFLHMWDVHFDYIPPRRYVELFDPEWDGEMSFHFHNPDIHRDMDPRALAHWIALYDGEIRFTDEILAEIFEQLDARGRFEDALVVITADHGEEFFDHGDKGHRRTLYEEVLRVPLIVRLPGGAAGGQVVDDLVGLIDVMPTLLSLVDVPLPRTVQGRDLTPLLRGEAMEPVQMLAELHWPKFVLQASRTQHDKIIRDGQGFEVYFDLRRDPKERMPLAKEHPGRAEARLRLEEGLRETAALRKSLGVGAAVESTMDAEVRRRLEILGYIEAE
jgi:arylsulfatase A-like enzyme